MEELGAPITGDEVDEQDVILMWTLLYLTPAQRMGYLYGMIDSLRMAREARRVG
jgi:hypothetical protein